ncbi:MAG: nucleotide sugar dehydrogenase [Candidatus Omnitrophica bacterium]|nr:nucleotide sugar dehydrogenase [Candidatus Omnitrophota bacterium]
MEHKKEANESFDIAIVGGLGHVGLPLGLVFADKGLSVCLCDIDAKKADMVKKAKMPFIEYGAEPILKKVIPIGMLKVSTDIKCVSKAKYVIVAIGTPIDEYLNPKVRPFLEFFAQLKKYLNKRQLIVVRSTVYPHTCKQLFRLFDNDKSWKLAYCPERIVQGYAIKELGQIPQIVAGMTEEAVRQSAELFSRICPKIIKVSMEEAELLKLFTNAWRYIQFAATNQFYMMAHNYGVDYDKLRRAMVDGYDRAVSIPGAGFAAGPCLLKDTMQLSAFYGTNFFLGHAAMLVNEGLPGFIVEDLKKRYDLSKTRVGILGMAFKADIDDIRDSLSYKLGKILRFNGTQVFYSDEFVKNPDFISKEKLISSSDAVIIGVPHTAYKQLKVPKGVEIIDLWGITRVK